MEIRSMFNTIFGKLFNGPRNLTRAKLLDGYSNDFIPFHGDAYDNATGRNCIDTIARHVGKLHPRHIVRKMGISSRMRTAGCSTSWGTGRTLS